jgi:hypothetical protein
MTKHTPSLPKYLHPVPIAITVIVLGAIMAVGASNLESGLLSKALQSVASVPGLSWVASWISPTSDPGLKINAVDVIPPVDSQNSLAGGGVLLADGGQGDQSTSLNQSSALLTPTPLAVSSSSIPTATETSLVVSETTTALPNESPTSTSAEDTTPTPSGTVHETITPTPTELPDTRHLSLSSVEVKPGEKFQVQLYCDNTEDVAGCDVGLEFEPNLLDLITVHKTDITDPFLLVKRKESGTFVLSLAGLDGLSAGGGVLLTFEGVASSSLALGQSAVVGFIKAKLYDTDSKAFEVRTANGMVRIKTDPTEAVTEIAQQTPAQEEEPTSISTTSTDVENEPVPEATSSLPSTVSTTPPASGGGGYPSGPIPTATPVTTSSPTSTPPAAVFPDAVTPTRLRADLNHDGEVNALDLMEFMRNWKVVFPSN